MLAEFIKQVEEIAQERGAVINVHIMPHGIVIEIQLPDGRDHTFDYHLEMKIAKEDGMTLEDDATFINYLISISEHYDFVGHPS